MKHIVTTFRFSVELGTRLRELRRRAGLNLRELAHRMGRRPGYHNHLARLEAGRLRFPTLALVVDYLRACHASVVHIAPFLDCYTVLPPVCEDAGRKRVVEKLAALPDRIATALDNYDVKTARARRARGGKKPLAPARRVQAVRRQAQAALERRGLDAVVRLEVDRLGVRPTLVMRTIVFDYAHKLWRILKQTRPQPRAVLGRPRKSRNQRLAEARAEMLAQAGDLIPAKGLDRIRDRVVRYFREVNREARKEE